MFMFICRRNIWVLKELKQKGFIYAEFNCTMSIVESIKSGAYWPSKWYSKCACQWLLWCLTRPPGQVSWLPYATHTICSACKNCLSTFAAAGKTMRTTAAAVACAAVAATLIWALALRIRHVVPGAWRLHQLPHHYGYANWERQVEQHAKMLDKYCDFI